MKKIVYWIVAISILLVACTPAEPVVETPIIVVTATPTGAAVSAAPSTLPPTNTPVEPTAVPPTNTPNLPPPTDPPPSPTAVETVAQDLALIPEALYIYPVPKIYEGDIVTFQFEAAVPSSINPDEVDVQLFINGQLIDEGSLNRRNLGGDTLGLFEWAWDTSNAVGLHTLELRLDPLDRIQSGDEVEENNLIVRELTVLPTDDRPGDWVTIETTYARVHTVTQTAANRDINWLIQEVDAAIAEASRMLGEGPDRKIDVYLIDRVIGQGGYAGGAMVVSYLDRNYSGGTVESVMIHEAVHTIDIQFAPNRIRFLGEGVALWATGGHYKSENLDARAAALIETGLYIPLEQLVNNFYPTQHEIGYLEAGAFVKFLVDQFGWERVRQFYADFSARGYESPAAALDSYLSAHFGWTLAEAEANWLAYLETLPYDPTAVPDLLATIKYYDTMRHYQIYYDPTAHFLNAWLPTPQEAQSRGLTADLTRHPSDEINIILEVMLVAADTALRTQDYQTANVLLDSVERIIDSGGVFVDPLSQSYRSIVQQALRLGYEPHQVTFDGTQATVLATRAGNPTLIPLNFSLNANTWTLTQ